MRDRATSLLFTGEHASHRIPAEYHEVEQRAGKAIRTHCGWDPGTLELAKNFARKFNAPLRAGKWSRLLIELNRSLHHPKLFSEFSKPLSSDKKQKLIDTIYRPHRTAVEQLIRDSIDRGRRVLHIGIHSFTPILCGEVRNADLGLLYDPKRKMERELSRRWASAIRALAPGIRVRMNYPYRGTDDGLTTALRKQFGDRDYLGIELEVNQRYPLGAKKNWDALQRSLMNSLDRIMA